MAYQEFTSPDNRVWLEYHNFSTTQHSQGTGRFGEWERSAGIGYTDETLLHFDISDLLFSTITNVDLEITCNSKGGQVSSQTGHLQKQDKSNPNSWSSIPRFDDFAVSAWVNTLASKTGMLNTGVYTFLNTTTLKNYIQTWLDNNPTGNWGLIVGITYGSLNWYLSLDSTKLKVTYTPPPYTIWGSKWAGYSGFSLSNCRLLGGLSPNVDNLKLKDIAAYVGSTHSEQVRLAVYQGGTLDNPVGASLVHDFGVTSGSATHSWISKGSADVSLQKNVPTWIAIKCNGSGWSLQYENDSSKSGDTQSARGRWSSTGISADENTAYPSTVPSGGAFDDFWYPLVLSYDIEPTGIVIPRRRIDIVQSY